VPRPNGVMLNSISMRFLFLPAVKGCNLSAKTNHCRHAHE
jgi:hypothetical protein